MSKVTSAQILFISRAYPPIIGGIENQNYELSQWLPRHIPTRTIANTHGKKFLPFFLLRILITLPFTAHNYKTILLGDGVLGIVAWWIKLFTQKKVFCIVHGLDLTYRNTFYQKWWVKYFIPQCDKLIAVGNQTIREGVKRGIPKDKFVFIPNGVHPEKFVHDDIAPETIFDVIGQKYRDKKILLTFGRLARRKGVAWFIRNVLPTLNNDVIYVVAGTGVDQDNITKAIREKKIDDRVILLGHVENEVRHKIFAGADVFIQPNIKVAGDMEGFGISVIEAGVSGIPVLAARLEGLNDAITDGKNGLLIESGNARAWREKVEGVLADDFDRKGFGLRARDHIIKKLSWEKISEKYAHVLKNDM